MKMLITHEKLAGDIKFLRREIKEVKKENEKNIKLLGDRIDKILSLIEKQQKEG